MILHGLGDPRGGVMIRTALTGVLLAAMGMGCWWRSPRAMQRDYADSLRPSQLRSDAPPGAGPQRTMRLRVYADADYRRLLSWRQHIRGVSPIFLEHGEGAWVWDVDGNRYVDLIQGLLPNVAQCAS